MTRPGNGAPGKRWSATDAAGYVFERLIAPAGGEAVGHGVRSDADGPAPGSAGASVEGMKVRASLARSIDTYAELLQQVFASFTSEVAQALTVQPAGAGQPTPVTILARPGSMAGGAVWIHNGSGGFVPAFTLHMTDLARADGSGLSADLGSTDPVRFEASLEPRRSAWVSIRVPEGTGLGYYYGHLIAQGLPDAAVPIRLVVR